MPFVKPLEQAVRCLDVTCYKVPVQHLLGKLQTIIVSWKLQYGGGGMKMVEDNLPIDASSDINTGTFNIHMLLLSSIQQL